MSAIKMSPALGVAKGALLYASRLQGSLLMRRQRARLGLGAQWRCLGLPVASATARDGCGTPSESAFRVAGAYRDAGRPGISEKWLAYGDTINADEPICLAVFPTGRYAA